LGSGIGKKYQAAADGFEAIGFGRGLTARQSADDIAKLSRLGKLGHRARTMFFEGTREEAFDEQIIDMLVLNVLPIGAQTREILQEILSPNSSFGLGFRDPANLNRSIEGGAAIRRIGNTNRLGETNVLDVGQADTISKIFKLAASDGGLAGNSEAFAKLADGLATGTEIQVEEANGYMRTFEVSEGYGRFFNVKAKQAVMQGRVNDLSSNETARSGLLAGFEDIGKNADQGVDDKVNHEFEREAARRVVAANVNDAAMVADALGEGRKLIITAADGYKTWNASEALPVGAFEVDMDFVIQERMGGNRMGSNGMSSGADFTRQVMDNVQTIAHRAGLDYARVIADAGKSEKGMKRLDSVLTKQGLSATAVDVQRRAQQVGVQGLSSSDPASQALPQIEGLSFNQMANLAGALSSATTTFTDRSLDIRQRIAVQRVQMAEEKAHFTRTGQVSSQKEAQFLQGEINRLQEIAAKEETLAEVGAHISSDPGVMDLGRRAAFNASFYTMAGIDAIGQLVGVDRSGVDLEVDTSGFGQWQRARLSRDKLSNEMSANTDIKSHVRTLKERLKSIAVKNSIDPDKVDVEAKGFRSHDKLKQEDREQVAELHKAIKKVGKISKLSIGTSLQRVVDVKYDQQQRCFSRNRGFYLPTRGKIRGLLRQDYSGRSHYLRQQDFLIDPTKNAC